MQVYKKKKKDFFIIADQEDSNYASCSWIVRIVKIIRCRRPEANHSDNISINCAVSPFVLLR